MKLLDIQPRLRLSHEEPPQTQVQVETKVGRGIRGYSTEYPLSSDKDTAGKQDFLAAKRGKTARGDGKLSDLIW